ncbi:plasmodesmata-located protein 8 [Mercurialis annua]|uniref:plasmodesmata-located protein 8 n=1 Tax=Mercurialis annua TaxID=3986 RepID=UPI00215E7998|nr:plasmodesmata-located protein 8 [Mercurialis annua]
MLKRSLHLHSTHKPYLPTLTRTTLIFLFIISITNHGISPVKAHIFIYSGCSQEKYQPNSPFEANLNSFLASVVSSSSEASYNSFSIGNGTSPPSPPDATVFGLYQCRGDLKTIDCKVCIQSTVNQIGLVCPNSYGAALQLEGCHLRYERSNFLGQLDTSVKYKKCSRSSVSNDVEFFRRRDDVLGDLETSTGFKVSSSGLVEGYDQCLGDLSKEDCSSCIGNVVAMLKNLCGSAAAADVYLGQCYARYWASGYYDVSDSSHEDQVGKTVAIIVGGVAGLAVLIVLLSFCRKSMG